MDNPPTRNQPTTSPNNGLAPRTAGNQTQVSQNANIYSPSSSRAPLTTTSLPASSAVSLEGPSNTGQRSSRRDDPLTEHYNVPLMRPKPWKSQSRTWTVSQLRREREEFFETRVTGQREVWDALRQVADCIREGDITTAQGILDAVPCTLPTGRLEDGTYDERGCLYKLPLNVLTNPTNMLPDENVDGETMVGVPSDSKEVTEIEKPLSAATLASTQTDDGQMADKGKAVIDEDAVKVKCRLSSTGSDVIILVGKSQKVATLAVRLREEATIPAATKIRIFYLGREMKEKKTLEDQDFREGHVLNVFVASIPS